MQRFSITSSLRLALAGLTVVLAAVAAVGVGNLLSARQRYDDTLARSSQLASAGAELATAKLAQLEIRHDARGPRAASVGRQVRLAVVSATARTSALARGEPPSRQLVAEIVRSSSAIRVLAASAQLSARQSALQRRAQVRARSETRAAVAVMGIAGGLALLAALALIGLLIRAMRGPLDQLVMATRRLAAGDLDQRVEPGGPSELRELGASFNAMAEALAGATTRIEQERERLARTIESLGDGVLVTEPGRSRIAAVNPRAAVLLPELSPGVDADGPNSPLPEAARALAAETTVEHRGRTLAVTAARLEAADGDGGMAWTVRDISERARLERAKSDFVATASHELRSPLTSIKGFVELLASAPGDMSVRQREFVDIILRSTDRLVELVGDLLDVARIEAGHVEINRRAIDASQALSEVAELMGPRVEARCQQLDLQLAPALPLAMADPARLRQVMANLITNAHLYTPEGGRITISAQADGPWVRLSVADTGVGMSEEELEHVFERFYRARDGRATPGTGLGLSIVRSLIDLHGGEIDVASEPGAGTTFTVRIPTATHALGIASSLEALRGRRVLVVDDEPQIAKLIADQLAPFEVACTIATGGEEALAQLADGRFDAITLDVRMPRVSGFDVLRRLRADPEHGSLPVVFVSVLADHPELAGEWVVSKPIDAAHMRGVLSSAVASGRSGVLVVARAELEGRLAPSLGGLGLDYQWETSATAAARVCRERRFEFALVDVGLPSPQAVLQTLNLRGRRLRRAVILLAADDAPLPDGILRLGLQVVGVEQAASALASALRERPAEDEAGSKPDLLDQPGR
jgi:signal transduction histidine kinase